MDKNVKILILSWELHPVFWGGLGILVRDVVNELRRQQVEVTILMPNMPDNIVAKDAINLYKSVTKFSKKELEIPGLDFEINVFEKNQKKYDQGVIWKNIFNPSKKRKPSSYIYPNEVPKISRAFAWAVAEWLKKNGKENYYDLILGMDWVTIPTFCLMKHLGIKTPFAFYINSTEYERSLDQKEKSDLEITLQKFEQRFFSQADQLISVSGITKNILVENYRLDPEKITVVYNDVDFVPEKLSYKLGHKGKNVLFLGRMSKQKGLPFLIDSAHKVVETDPSVHFFLAGDGEMLPQTVELVSHRALEKNVHFLGWSGLSEKKLLYNACDLFVMPSPSEPFGLTAFEAIKSGVAVIASQNCGFVDVVKSTPTFRYYDIQSFSNLILYYLQNPFERQILLQKQQTEVNLHSWPKEVNKIINLTTKTQTDSV